LNKNQLNWRKAMKWSFKLGRLLGVDVYVHFTFLLLLGFVGLAHWMTGRSLEAAVTGVMFFIGLFLCVLLHEYGHALAARRYGITTRDITLLPIGGLARLERMPDKPSQELVVALAGPIVNVVIAAGLFAGLHLAGNWQSLGSLTTTGGSLVERLLVVNLFLVLFNLLPAFPMDGGRVLRSVLAMKMEYARATRIAARTGQGMAALFGLAGLFGNPMLLLIAVFVWIGAGQEAAAAEMKSAFAGARVRDAMLTDFRTLAPTHTLGEAARLLLAGSQRDFPVVDNGRFAGVLTHTGLINAVRERGEGAFVGDVMERDFPSASVGEKLDPALARVESGRTATLPVLLNGHLVGLLTAGNVGEFYLLRRALAERRRKDSPAPPVIRLPAPPRLARQWGS
jgi:Zn-dependent protease